MTKNPGYDVRADFASVSLVTRFPLVIVTNPNLPVRNTAEFIAMAKAAPGKYSFGSSGIGGASHIPLEAFKFQAGIDMIHVPFRGSSQTTVALLGGQIDLTVDGLAPQLGHIREGRVRPLGITTKARTPFMPDLPTIAETLPGYAFPMWVAVFAPAKTPKAIIDKLSAAIAATVKDPTIKKRYEDLLVEPVGDPAELDRFFEGARSTGRHRRPIARQVSGAGATRIGGHAAQRRAILTTIAAACRAGLPLRPAAASGGGRSIDGLSCNAEARPRWPMLAASSMPGSTS